MIAVDSCSLIAFFAGGSEYDISLVRNALAQHALLLPPVVVVELFSDPKLDKSLRKSIKALPILEITEGFWQRAGLMRATLLKKKSKALLADVLIAQSCIDHDVSLITRDKDFRHFEKDFGLKLL